MLHILFFVCKGTSYTMPCAIIMKVLGYAALRRAGFHTMPCAIIALATFMKPAMLAPRT